MGLQGYLRQVFLEHHSDLFQVRFWQQVQEKLAVHGILCILPYDQSKRLRQTEPAGDRCSWCPPPGP
ncbi:MAG: bifunctional isocitrate dehydrogenase kinase/phosphatase [Deltaproteobacteria bacterium]|nr:bifunctional isocitrate dehydrogenase kinase/phosphatase [Deltaproteobacteria bacterium]MBW2070694.1 bifunctional isocitrate dehydrogenase kinase/phosphatase [Deltaproteobacteria bacterium]